MKNRLKERLKVWLEIFLISTRLGLISFGGPIAHLGYFYEEYILRRKWVSEKNYADLVSLCQFLPGPTSSQVGIGVLRGGMIGGILSFLGFTIPSVIILMIFASLLNTFEIEHAGWIRGLKIVAVVVVAHAVLGMAKSLTTDIQRKTIALGALIITLLWPSSFTHIMVIGVAGIAGFLLYKQKKSDETKEAISQFSISHRFSYVCLILFFGLLFILPILRTGTALDWLILFDCFYRAGSLVFGGGHVVLPLLEHEFVSSGLLSEQEFLAGYGAAQAIPGPLFTFSAYIGTVIHGWQSGILATIAIFLPAFLLTLGILPFWDTLRRNFKVKAALNGINASVVGILFSALYHPIWTSSIQTTQDFALGAILYSLLAYWKLPPWIIVLIGALGGIFIT